MNQSEVNNAWSIIIQQDRENYYKEQEKLKIAYLNSHEYAALSEQKKLEKQAKKKIYRTLYRIQVGLCLACKKHEDETGRAHSVHRIIPRTKGGTYVLENCVLVCASCHSRYEGRSRLEFDILFRGMEYYGA